jgi:hypothetical protein
MQPAAVKTRPPRQIGRVISVEDWALDRRLVADGVPQRQVARQLPALCSPVIVHDPPTRLQRLSCDEKIPPLGVEARSDLMLDLLFSCAQHLLQGRWARAGQIVRHLADLRLTTLPLDPCHLVIQLERPAICSPGHDLGQPLGVAGVADLDAHRLAEPGDRRPGLVQPGQRGGQRRGPR